MTAEIALLNPQAIALAADSAVTIRSESHLKVRPTANKIFSLSKYEPVAVMVYDQAELAGIPWETLVKEFRSHLRRRTFPDVSDYATEFFSFISNSGIIPDALQTEFFVNHLLASYMEMLKDTLIRRLRAREQTGKPITSVAANRLFATLVREHLWHWDNTKFLEDDGPIQSRRLRRDLGGRIEKTIVGLLGNLSLSKATQNFLLRIACQLPFKWPERLTPPKSGVVVAGFGTASVFPSLDAYEVSGILRNRVKRISDRASSARIGVDTTAAIIPFAQRDWVDAFLFGLHPMYEFMLQELVTDLVAGVAHSAIDQCKSLTRQQKTQEKKRFAATEIAKVAEEKLRAIDDYTFKEFAQPVVSTLASLPKEELAAVAESLVGLTSFRQQVTMEAETVGGPVDVALISKGDGLIWIKRKHYFERKFNPQFFANYYREDEDGQQQGS